MPNQESPNITFLNIRVTQELKRKVEIEAKSRKMQDTSAFVRHLIMEATLGVTLTHSDYELIEKRIARKRSHNG